MPTDTPEPDTDAPVDTFILKGSRLAKRLRAEIQASQQFLLDLGGIKPRLATLMVGNDPAAVAYRNSIERTFGRAAIDHSRVELPANAPPERLLETIETLNVDPQVTGILVLMPLPDQLDDRLVLEHLSPLKDVDGITPTNAGRLHLGLPSLRPSTPAGGLSLLDHYGVTLAGTRVAVIGRSNVVGRPLATLLTQRNATVTLCHTRTRDLGFETRSAQIICVAAGHPGLITADMVTPGSVVLDFGVNVTPADKLVGDADFAGLQGVAGAITPVPGGTGPVTALTLARNTLAAGFAALGGDLDHVEYTLPEPLRQHIDSAAT